MVEVLVAVTLADCAASNFRCFPTPSAAFSAPFPPPAPAFQSYEHVKTIGDLLSIDDLKWRIGGRLSLIKDCACDLLYPFIDPQWLTIDPRWSADNHLLTMGDILRSFDHRVWTIDDLAWSTNDFIWPIVDHISTRKDTLSDNDDYPSAKNDHLDRQTLVVNRYIITCSPYVIIYGLLKIIHDPPVIVLRHICLHNGGEERGLVAAMD